MNRLFFKIFLGLFVFFVGVSPAMAQYAVDDDVVFDKVRDWQIGEIMAEDTGQFAYCAGEAIYENGLTLIFARTAIGQVNIVIGFPDGGLDVGASYPVTVQVDDRVTRQLVANVSHEELLVIPMGEDDELYEALRVGNAVHIIAPDDRVSFALSGTAAALNQLRECSEANNVNNGSDIRSNLPPALGGLLYAAGLEDAQLVDLTDEGGEVPEDAPDYLWVFGPTLGGVIQRVWEADGGVEEFSAKVEEYVDQLEPQCEGDFYAEKLDILELNNSYLQPVDIYCTSGLDGHFTALLLLAESIEDSEETIGRFTVFFQEGEGPGEEVAQQVRDNIALVLRHLNGDDIE